MTPAAAVTLALVSIALVFWTLTKGQMTELDKGTCTYSFVIPQNDLISTSKLFSNQQVESFQKKIDEIESKVDTLSGRQRNSARPDKGSFSCSCDDSVKFEFAYSDCDDVKVISDSVSGIYQIDPIKKTGALIEVYEDKIGSRKPGIQKYWAVATWGAISVYCDLKDEDVGWTILMRRSKMDISFDRNWNDYKWGFGEKTKGGDFWLGLEHMYRITNQLKKRYSLWIVIVDDRKVSHIFPYGNFRIDNESTNYTTTVEDYHGRDFSKFYTQTQFSTRDHGPAYDRGKEIGYLPQSGGGWWFLEGSRDAHTCGYMNLNAPKPFLSDSDSIASVVMKVKPSEK